MSRLRQRFDRLRATGRTALVAYITAGDPARDASVPLMHALVAAGADVIELGVPFSDPMADGPVIQAACERALAGGTTLRDVLELVRVFRADDAETPVVLMGYLNPIDRMGIAVFAERAAAVGVDGALIVDMSAEEAPDIAPTLCAHGIDPVCLIAPTTGTARIERICAHAAGFVYYVAVKGVTGTASLEVSALADQIAPIRERTDLPVAVGFGVRTPEDAAQVARVADAVVVGSALVRHIGDHAHDFDAARNAIGDTLAAMRGMIDQHDQTSQEAHSA